ncbi:DUF2244 domain-containing protein [Pseudorhodobacter sp. E13]|uniref:DUF2244 domain-containing protein n=1 Tax=Pseudorhodobacter sp. E13 TaxID=2487931 RepID=UPI000F8E467F|nr:DUF2244 domain-containing protein [Pseudorhodobacter sp. E13]RUS58504.1 DUF2244 domain-containing protein [Pseudorhodobacter sp. E13]
MPYEWSDTTEIKALHLWPYRSLPRRGFVWFIGGTACLIAVPLLAVMGSPVFWGLLPFLVLAVSGMYWALERSYRDAEIIETLTLSENRLHLARIGPRGKRQEWEANPHWVRVEQHKTGGPVAEYITLAGGPRAVELGAFLSEEERKQLAPELRQALRAHNQRT